MEIQRISCDLLKERLDPKFYGAKFVTASARLARCGFKAKSLASLVAADAPITYGIVQPGNFVSWGDGVRMIRAVDICDGAVTAQSTKWVSHEIELPYARARVRAGDYLITIAGTVGEVAIAPKHIEPANLNQSVARLRLQPGSVDPGWLLAFHLSETGRLGLLREQRGSIQQHLNIEDIGPICIPIPDLNAQGYIGDKLRQAESLRDRARKLEENIRQEYRAALDRLGYEEAPHHTAYRTKVSDRLDAAFYDPTFTIVLDSPWLSANSEPLSRFILDGSYGDLPDSGTYGTGSKWLLRATDLDQCVTHWDAGVRVPSEQLRWKSEVKENDILLEVKGAIEKCAIGRGPAVGKHVNGTVFRFSPTGINPGYLCLHLTAEIKRKYAAREAVNNIIQYLNLDCIRSLPVLRLPASTEARLGEGFLAAVDALSAATKLISAAKALVEQLIDGRTTETDLIAAQAGLQTGDRREDRAIMGALRQCNTDANSDHLFKDLEGLYMLLDKPDLESYRSCQS